MYRGTRWLHQRRGYLSMLKTKRKTKQASKQTKTQTPCESHLKLPSSTPHPQSPVSIYPHRHRCSSVRAQRTQNTLLPVLRLVLEQGSFQTLEGSGRAAHERARIASRASLGKQLASRAPLQPTQCRWFTRLRLAC